MRNVVPSFRRLLPLVLLGAGVAVTTLPNPAFSAGGEGGSSTPTCTKGKVYDTRSKKCVSKNSSAVPDKDRTEYAFALAEAGRYEEALEILDTLKDPNTKEAWNYRGYATRKLGRTDEGISYYKKSVALDPQYAKVREYLGEAYVIKGQMDLAKEQLMTIKSICGTTCEEYEDLHEAIENPSKI
ncbi:tetratricopeptide repeat protein [Phyllobacterium lublinensis]|uniref:tetratricopeptide repeat protein n=1 Tax=Phyllobacterium lublinensis TaxID=2875708 RepID=UPI001CCE7B2C|nr:tetratricopeptide repeat protein [Phyllobacterium sp. 2063]MBZ9654852.1 tetratricopeptide repeat protein [Phyllobacterium sp. 2063]